MEYVNNFCRAWMMTKTMTAIGIILAAATLAVADDKITLTKFGKDDLGKTPAGWKAAQTGKGESVWKVVADDTAPSKTGFALAQTTADQNAIFNLCVADVPSFKDLEATVSFKAVKGEKDQGGGIVWRYQDANNYYIARMNPLEDNFRVYKVVDGKRAKEFQNAEVKILTGEWHSLKIKMVGDHIECCLDSKKYLDVQDDTFTKAGKVGLWTKADAQTHFDQFVVSGVGDDAKDKPLSPVEARKKLGDSIILEMTVKTAKDRLEKRGEIYLDAEDDFRDEKNFAVVITKAGAASLKDAGIDEPAKHFEGKRIRAIGTVKEVDKVPRIEIDEAKQIRIVE
jgi:hypothetical protein